MINNWLEQPLDRFILSQAVDKETQMIICPAVPNEIRDLLDPFIRLSQSQIFMAEFKRELGKPIPDLHQLALRFGNAQQRHQTITKQFEEGKFALMIVALWEAFYLRSVSFRP